MRKPLSFLAEHDLQGHWFVPQAEVPRAPGRLKVGRDGCRLELDALLNGSGHQTEPDVVVPVIHGCTSEGEAVSLFRSFRSSWKTRRGGSADEEVCTESFRTHTVIVGAHVDSESQCFPAIRARVPGLLTWIDDSAISEPTRIADADADADTDDNAYGLTMNLKSGTICMSDHDAIPGRVTISKHFTQTGNRFDTLSWTSEGWVEIRPAAPQPIQQLLGSLDQVRSMFGLLAGPLMHFDAIELALDDSQFAGLLFIPNRHRICHVAHPLEFLIPFDSIRATLPVLVDAWLARMPKIRTVNALFESAQLLEKRPWHLLFLTLTHALEGLHRSLHVGVYMEPEDYKAVYQEIVFQLPKSLAPDHLQSLKQRIEHANEISFRKRLLELVASLPADLRLLTTGQQTKVPDVWITTRNAYTHWLDGSTSNAVEGMELHGVNTRLLMLVRVLLLMMIQVPPDLVVSALRGQRNQWARALSDVAAFDRRQALVTQKSR